MASIPIEVVCHRDVIEIVLGQNHRHESIEVIGLHFIVGLAIVLFVFAMLVAFTKFSQFNSLRVLQPLKATLENIRKNRHIVLLSHGQTMDHLSCQMGRRVFAVAGEPTPAAIGKLHLCEGFNTVGHDSVHLDVIEDRIEVF